MAKITRYHPLLAMLHWILAALILGALYFGATVLTRIPNDSTEKLHGLAVHMIAGIVILTLMLARLFARMATSHPPKPETGSPFLDGLARFSHRAFYLVVFGMGLMGLTLALQAGLFNIVFGNHGSLPPSLWIYWPRWVHYFLSRILILLIGLHICGVIYHAAFLRDGLLRRMFLGKRRQV